MAIRTEFARVGRGEFLHLKYPHSPVTVCGYKLSTLPINTRKPLCQRCVKLTS